MPPKDETSPNADIPTTEGSTAASSSSSPSSSSPLVSSESTTKQSNSQNDSKAGKRLSLQDRGKVPFSMYVTLLAILGIQYSVGAYSMETVTNVLDTMKKGGLAIHGMLVYIRDLSERVFNGQVDDWKEPAFALLMSGLVGCILYVLIGAPLKAGLWTGRKAKRHVAHRYMGLLFLVQYGAAWAHFLSDYEDSTSSFITHFISLNGIIQGVTAYFSFKVLPDLNDAGYYSDKAVMSRSFVHENIYYSLLAVFGSAYYNSVWQDRLKENPVGQIIEILFVFFPYVVLRPIYPVTRFKDAGKTQHGRSKQNEYFYTVATKMVKFFYLWAKYFLGFYINFMVFLNLTTPKEWKLIRGMYLLNVGTVSIAIFLHTLRFKKVLPPKLTFSVYLLQIYATFSVIPIAFSMFIGHKLLCGLCLFGVLCNMTRKREVHAVWCALAFYLMNFRDDIEW